MTKKIRFFFQNPRRPLLGARLSFIQMKTQNKFSLTSALVGVKLHQTNST
jgi:hypothetical protein